MQFSLVKYSLLILAFCLVACSAYKKVTVDFSKDYSFREETYLDIFLYKVNETEIDIFLSLNERAYFTNENLMRLELRYVNEENQAFFILEKEVSLQELSNGINFKTNSIPQIGGNLVFRILDSEGNQLINNHININESLAGILLKNFKGEVIYSELCSNEKEIAIFFEDENCDSVFWHFFQNSLVQFPLSPYNVKDSLIAFTEKEIVVKNGQKISLKENNCFVCKNQTRSFYTTINCPADFNSSKLDSIKFHALKYICTQKEYEQLESSPDIKTAIDEYWLAKGGAFERAAKLMNAFNDRVENAIEMFSVKNLGYLSDRGMVYIVMGKPKLVEKYQSKEVWYYPNYERAYFVFEREEYGEMVLIRKEAYEAVWNKAVGYWYNGVLKR